MLVIEDIIGRCAPVARDRPGRAAPPQLLRRRPGHAVRPAGAAPRAAGRGLGAGRPRRPSSTRRRAEIAAYNAAHPHTKRGLAITPVKFGISFNFTTFNQGGALVHVYKDGSVLINHGGTEMGQGLHTKMLQVAATALGLPLERVRLAPTRTDKVPNTSATAASRRRGPQRRRGQGRLRADPGPAGAGAGRAPRPLVGRAGRQGLPPAHPAVGGRLLQDRGAELGPHHDDRLAVQVLRLRRRRGRGGGRRVHRRLHDAAGRHRPRRRRQPLAAGRPRADRGRLRAGRRLADAGGPALGRVRRAGPRPAHHPGRVDLQAAVVLRDAERVQRRAAGAGPRGRRGLRLQGGRRAAADAGVQRARGAARRVRGVRPAGSAARAGLAGHARGGLLGARPARAAGARV